MIGLKYQACVMLILHVNILILPIILIDLLNQFRQFHFFVIDNFSQFYVSLWDYTNLYERLFLFMHKWLFNKCQLKFFFLSMFTRLWWNTFSTGNYRLRPLDLSARLPRDFYLLSWGENKWGFQWIRLSLGQARHAFCLNLCKWWVSFEFNFNGTWLCKL